jgi:hypothetical protein
LSPTFFIAKPEEDLPADTPKKNNLDQKLICVCRVLMTFFLLNLCSCSKVFLQNTVFVVVLLLKWSLMTHDHAMAWAKEYKMEFNFQKKNNI